MVDHCTALILRGRHQQMQKGSKNIMGRQRGAIEHRVFVGLVSRIRVLPSSRAAVAVAVASIEHYGHRTCIGKSGRWPRRSERVCLSVRGIALCTHATSHKAVKIAIIMLCLPPSLPRWRGDLPLPPSVQSFPLQSIRHQRRMDSRAIGPAQSDIGIYGHPPPLKVSLFNIF